MKYENLLFFLVLQEENEANLKKYESESDVFLKKAGHMNFTPPIALMCSASPPSLQKRWTGATFAIFRLLKENILTPLYLKRLKQGPQSDSFRADWNDAPSHCIVWPMVDNHENHRDLNGGGHKNHQKIIEHDGCPQPFHSIWCGDSCFENHQKIAMVR